MPNKPYKKCTYPGCKEITQNGRCEKHQIKNVYKKHWDEKRPSATKRGYNYKWQKASKQFLKDNPYCVCAECKRLKRVLFADVVHHEPPHHGDMEKFWDKTTWRPYNKRCHDKHTAKTSKQFLPNEKEQ